MRRAISILGVNELINRLERAKSLFFGSILIYTKRFKGLLEFQYLYAVPKITTINTADQAHLAFVAI